ncbi:hypothetical protein [Aeromonas veronii]|uniref:hypothetical protein n=1 Tax=Aeromonas veronii TaxID=654 RepID=UPI003D1BC430
MTILKNAVLASTDVSALPGGQLVNNICRPAVRLIRNGSFAVATRGTTFNPAIAADGAAEQYAHTLTGWRVHRNGPQVVNADQFKAEATASPLKSSLPRGMAISWYGTAGTDYFTILEQVRFDVETVAGQLAQLAISGFTKDAGTTRTMIAEAVVIEDNGTISKSLSNPFTFTDTETTQLVSLTIPPILGKKPLGSDARLVFRIWLTAGSVQDANITAISKGDGFVTFTGIHDINLPVQDYVDALRDCEKYYVKRTEKLYFSVVGSTDTGNSVCAVTFQMAMAKAPIENQIALTYINATAAEPRLSEISRNHVTLVAIASQTTDEGAAVLTSRTIDIEPLV